MNLIADNPVLRRELRRRLRIRVAGRPWMAGVAVLVAVTLWYYGLALFKVSKADQMDASDWWGFTVYGLLFIICLLAPAISATSISQERERQTWEGLALTRLSAGQVLLGKWLAHLAAISFIPVLLFPLAIVSAISGKTGIWTTIAVYCYLFLNSAFFVGLGLLCSFRLPRSPWATATALVSSAVICLGTAVVDGIISLFRQFGNNGHETFFALNINPFWVLGNMVNLSQGFESLNQSGLPWDYTTYVVSIVVSVGFELTGLALSLRWMAARYGKPAVR